MRRRWAVLAALGLPVIASAQEWTPPERAFRVGAFYLTPRLQLKNAGRDTNVFNSAVDPVTDTSMVLSPGLRAETYLKGRARLVLDGSLDWNYFRENESERSVDPRGELQLEWSGGPFLLGVRGGASRSKQRFSPDLDERVWHSEGWGGASLTTKLGGRVSLEASGERRRYTYDDVVVDGQSVKETLDRVGLTGSLEVRYSLTKVTSLVVSGTALRDEFEYGPPSASEVQSRRYLAGFETTDDALVKGVVLAGIREFPPSEGSTVTAYRGPALQGRVRLPWRSNLLVLSGEQDVYYAATGGTTGEDRLRNTYVSKRLLGELFFGLPLGLILRAHASYESARFLVPQPDVGERVDRVDGYGGGLLRQLGSLFRLGFGVEYVRRTSNAPGYSYDGLRYGVQAELAP